MYYCKTSKKCKKIPKGHRVGKDGMLVKGVRWQDSDGDGKWYEPGDDVSEGNKSESFEIQEGGNFMRGKDAQIEIKRCWNHCLQKQQKNLDQMRRTS